ncbi:hypothetical protein [Brevundimonas sp. NIBR11]|uniref:hypothetical protein n=1 Tax=Brevundimonas sp. NIBR11 TaxID=3015999 RepID=UPI0022F0CD02|nr:hypothetical protein [Brevundimonas sp. NIBR11]WGM30024.1 hypothetical protein KKHFBJBL_00239 [Brevundimonas sp. NIBR11]
MIGRTLAPVGVALALAGCTWPEDRIADRIENLLMTPASPEVPAITTWPPDAAPLATYVRFYQPAGGYDDPTLPLTTIAGPMPDWPDESTRRVVVAVYVRENGYGSEGRPAGRVHVKAGELPAIFHGGCEVVNVIYDPKADAILGVWCNYDDTVRPPLEA